MPQHNLYITLSEDRQTADRHETRDLVLGRACSSNVKVVLRHVLGRVDVYASVAGPKLVT